jgi:putative acetyltransferase
MISYQIATSADAERLLRTRRHTVLGDRSGRYSQTILDAWAPIVSEERIFAEANALENPSRVTIMALDEKNIAGLCSINTSEGLLQQCYVLPEYNNKGIARELVQRAEAIAKESGLKLLVLSSSLIALEFYKKQGYEELNNYLYDLGNGLQMPCVMMQKTL